MEKLKRKLAVVLATVMVFTSVVPAFAEAVPGPEGSEQLYTGAEEKELIFPEELREDAEYAGSVSFRRSTPSNAEHPDEAEAEDEIGMIPEETGPEEPEQNPEDAVPGKAAPSDAEYAEVFETVVDGVKITVTADAGVFPEGAQLWAEKVEEAATEEAIDKAIEEEKSEKEAAKKVASSIKFDIKMLLDGEEVQPDTGKGTVKISFARQLPRPIEGGACDSPAVRMP